MDKYGVVREFECECGSTIKTTDLGIPLDTENKKTAQLIVANVPDHEHKFKELKDVDGATEGRSVRADGLVAENEV